MKPETDHKNLSRAAAWAWYERAGCRSSYNLPPRPAAASTSNSMSAVTSEPSSATVRLRRRRQPQPSRFKLEAAAMHDLMSAAAEAAAADDDYDDDHHQIRATADACPIADHAPEENEMDVGEPHPSTTAAPAKGLRKCLSSSAASAPPAAAAAAGGLCDHVRATAFRKSISSPPLQVSVAHHCGIDLSNLRCTYNERQLLSPASSSLFDSFELQAVMEKLEYANSGQLKRPFTVAEEIASCSDGEQCATHEGTVAAPPNNSDDVNSTSPQHSQSRAPCSKHTLHDLMNWSDHHIYSGRKSDCSCSCIEDTDHLGDGSSAEHFSELKALDITSIVCSSDTCVRSKAVRQRRRPSVLLPNLSHSLSNVLHQLPHSVTNALHHLSHPHLPHLHFPNTLSKALHQLPHSVSNAFHHIADLSHSISTSYRHHSASFRRHAKSSGSSTPTHHCHSRDEPCHYDDKHELDSHHHHPSASHRQSPSHRHFMPSPLRHLFAQKSHHYPPSPPRPGVSVSAENEMEQGNRSPTGSHKSTSYQVRFWQSPDRRHLRVSDDSYMLLYRSTKKHGSVVHHHHHYHHYHYISF